MTPFTSPHQSTNPAGLGAQSAAVANSTANAAADGGNWLGNLIITIGEAFAPFAPEVTVALVAVGEAINALPFPSFFADDFTILDGILAFYATIGSIQNIESMSSGIIGTEDTLGLVPHAAAAAADAPNALAALGGEPAMGAELGPIAAELSSGNRIGQMSVPPSWSEPKVTTIKALQATPLTTLPTDEVPASGIPGMPGMDHQSAAGHPTDHPAHRRGSRIRHPRNARNGNDRSRPRWRRTPIRSATDRDAPPILRRITKLLWRQNFRGYRGFRGFRAISCIGSSWGDTTNEKHRSAVSETLHAGFEHSPALRQWSGRCAAPLLPGDPVLCRSAAIG
ncbi:hypothetical protein DSM43519_04528 [Mycobacterium marinum]|nr:hypothetical protein DSM43519_04528 [Mycobacterium marinum]